MSPATPPIEEQDRQKIPRQDEQIEETQGKEDFKIEETDIGHEETDIGHGRNGKTDTLIKSLMEQLEKINKITNKEDFINMIDRFKKGKFQSAHSSHCFDIQIGTN
ncbi:hypothetical protein JTB14_017315 [Gonioctena quinquepunctata]|nr:hypothetical protein JTB14_017315 [Gonioctena quinquepunctata]